MTVKTYTAAPENYLINGVVVPLSEVTTVDGESFDRVWVAPNGVVYAADESGYKPKLPDGSEYVGGNVTAVLNPVPIGADCTGRISARVFDACVLVLLKKISASLDELAGDGDEEMAINAKEIVLEALKDPEVIGKLEAICSCGDVEEECQPYVIQDDETLVTPPGQVPQYVKCADGSVTELPAKRYVYKVVTDALKPDVRNLGFTSDSNKPDSLPCVTELTKLEVGGYRLVFENREGSYFRGAVFRYFVEDGNWYNMPVVGMSLDGETILPDVTVEQHEFGVFHINDPQNSTVEVLNDGRIVPKDSAMFVLDFDFPPSVYQEDHEARVIHNATVAGPLFVWLCVNIPVNR